MTEHATLAAALAAFQAEVPSVAKGKKANVPTKTGGSYSYSYADLADVADAAYPILAKHGLSFTCSPRLIEGRLVLRGTLLHASGRRHGYLPLGGSTPQEIGSSITYARRYLLGCLTGVVTDDDDDGQQAQQVAKRRPTPKAEPEPSPITAAKRRLAELGQPRMPQGAVLGPWLRGQLAERHLNPDVLEDVETLITEWSQP